MNIYFDIETGPIAYDELAVSIPEFDASKHPELPPFDPSEVKLGSLKDQKKIDAKIQQARQKHAEAVLEREKKMFAAQSQHTAKHVEKAALHAATGRVLMIGVRRSGESLCVTHESETTLLEMWWNSADWHYRHGSRLIGFNIFHFDLPFLIRRSWKHGIEVPCWVRPGRYWSDSFVDVLDIYQMGNRQEFISLDALDRFTGGEGKTENGAGFWQKWQTDREVAIAYALKDVEIAERLARRLGIEEFNRTEAMAGQQGAPDKQQSAGGADKSARSLWTS